MLLILLTAVFLRFYDIADVPPGLTHDEADHGITSLAIVNGMREIYFSIGYGREPLYDYSTAVLTAILGPTYLAGRLTAVFFSLLFLSASYAWVRIAFDEATALLTAAGLAVGFWSLMVSRQSLRSITLPATFTLSLFFFWRGLKMRAKSTQRKGLHQLQGIANPKAYFLISGLLLGVTFYTYIPARVLWLVVPLSIVYLAIARPRFYREAKHDVLLLLVVAVVIVIPLLAFLVTHPSAESRVAQLIGPMRDLLHGNATPIIDNAIAGLRIFTIEGDSFWRYNLPGRPLLQPVMGGLFYLGIAVAVWRAVRPGAASPLPGAYISGLSLLILGALPVLVTGPDLSTTQAIGMQPALYLFPAIGLATLGGLSMRLERASPTSVQWMRILRMRQIVPLFLFAGTAAGTAEAYFVLWARAPEVRVQYETTLITAIAYLNESSVESAAISTVSPNRYHSPAVAQMTMRNSNLALRWFDGRHSLVLPADSNSLVVVPGFAPIAPELASFFESAHLVDILPQPSTDLDRPIRIYRVDGVSTVEAWRDRFGSHFDATAGPLRVGNAAEFLGYKLLTTEQEPGSQIRIATLWKAVHPAEDLLLFTHLLDLGGRPIAQADRLDVPSAEWQTGDMFIQMHELTVPNQTAVGDYLLVTGLCQQLVEECLRLPIEGVEVEGDLIPMSSISVTE